MKKINYKRILGSLNQSPTDKIFLENFRTELDGFVLSRPIEGAGFFILFRKTATVFGVFSFILLSSGGLAYASQFSLPGQLLYPVKITTEKAQLAIARNPEKRKELRLKFIEHRINEVETISKEKNINKNAAQALAIIDEQIKEIENDDKQITKTEAQDKNATAQNEIKADTASSSTTTTQENISNVKNDNNKKSEQQSRKAKRNELEKTKDRLKESQLILEKLLNNNEPKKDRLEITNKKERETIRAESNNNNAPKNEGNSSKIRDRNNNKAGEQQNKRTKEQ